MVKPAPISRRSSRAASDGKEDRESKPAKQIDPHYTEDMAVHVASNHQESVQEMMSPSDAVPASAEADIDSGGECPRKLVRK